MSDQRPSPSDPATREAAALRQAGASPLRPGDPERVGPYVPLALLGSGGMGRVYLARPVDDSPGLVAVKVIRPEYAEDPRFRRRFEREAAVHARLRTPHAPRLCGTGFRDELLWMATEYLPGPDLAESVREDGALTPATVWQVADQLARALCELAAAGIVHRDLKPSNVLLTVRGAHVIDFGISKAVDASSITGTGNRVGTPAYMSPEHLRTGHSDTASDVFSLAGTLVFAASGRAPFGDGTGVDVMHRVAFEEPDQELLAEISSADPALGALLSACLAKEPEQRPTPAELLETAVRHAGPPGWPDPLGSRVLARQRAYEVLFRLPAERRARSGSRPPVPPPPPADEPRLSPAPPHPLVASLRSRKPLLAGAAAVAVCLIAACVYALTRQDAPAAAHSPGSAATAPAGSGPGGTASSPSHGAGSGPSTEGAPGSAAGPDGSTGDTSAPLTTTSPPPSDAATATPATPPAESGASTASAPAAGSPSAEPATAPWNTDCTHYSGNGRTRQGDTGKRVLQVQCMLTKRGYGVGDSGADGIFGSGTDTAVRAFQREGGLSADGIVGHDTWTALRDED
ncbi:protein kinase [Streptomyces phaeoluteigriseus]|uniref:Protein kinase n=1 Tax=Streptomyces phaeoluteigriseus TaxID=114686 RepID=A0ABY4ZIQ5_9ACTN|nr:protein kinase [Streptomyces phaeoluteigriseus]USQ88167.1 protein kinase [Streptomyces phaeoluteigriseus]